MWTSSSGWFCLNTAKLRGNNLLLSSKGSARLGLARIGSAREAKRRRWKLDARDESWVFKESRDTSKSAGIQQPITAANKYFLLTTVCFAPPSDGLWETAEHQQQQQHQLADK